MKTLKSTLLFLFFNASYFAQNIENLETTYISTGEKVRANEVIVRFNDKLLDKDIVDNFGQQKKALNQYLHFIGKEELKKIKKLKFSIEKLQMKKMFKNIKSCDLKSISRTGKVVDVPPFWATFIVDIPTGFTIEETIEELKKAFPVVLFAHPNYILKNQELSTNDTYYQTEQHSLNSTTYPNAHINMDSAWTIETGKPFIKVGLFDTGIDREHEDLHVLTSVSITDYTPQELEELLIDEQGHGTFVAGIIAAKRNNGIGIAGIAGGGTGDSLSSPGVSLLNFSTYPYQGGYDFEKYANMVIDAARSPLTNYNYPSCNNEAGYGIHVANHSYHSFYTYESDEEITEDIPPPDIPNCDLCYEAFLFSMQNGVVNVVSRGNNKYYHADQTTPNSSLPQSFADSWVISVGASGNDGQRMNGPQNGTEGETLSSPIGQNIDLLAPGSFSIVYTTRSQDQLNNPDGQKYSNFNGTSASAPHVTGVVALMLSYYNIPDCYSNTNLDPADVEYILQKSAVDLNSPGYDDSTGHGRLDAYKALKMIQYPEYQIVHPESLPVSTQIIAQDTIVLELKSPLSIATDVEGPLGVNFPLQADRIYEAIRYKIRLKYNFSNPYLTSSSAQILDSWVRHSGTNSLGLTADSAGTAVPQGTTGNLMWETTINKFNIEPNAEIVNLDTINGTIELDGYYYYFKTRYDNTDTEGFTDANPISSWYPINPFIANNAKIEFSVYLSDSLATQRFISPCDSINPINLGVQEKLQNNYILSPNPSSEKLNLTIEQGNIENLHFIFVDLNGKEIAINIKKEESTFIFNVESLKSGLYFLKIFENNELKEIKKWIKL